MTKILTENAQQEIEITDDTIRLAERCVDAVCEFEECDFDAEVSITFVDSEEIRALNNEHRGKDAVTDVLSFPILEFDEDGNIINSEFDFDDELVVLGDIVICAKRAKEQAEEYGHSFEREIAFLTVHSMLHLLGYDHVNGGLEQAIMREKEEKILDELGLAVTKV